MLSFLLRVIYDWGSRTLSRLRTLPPRLTGATVRAGTAIGPGCEVTLGAPPSRRGRLALGERNRLGPGVLLHPYGGSIETGSDVYIGPSTVIYGHGGVTIGKDTLIAMHCRILSSDHEIPPPGTIIRSRPDRQLPTRIGADVWLGAGVTVLGGVTIGDGCVVGAGAVVADDLPPWSIALGVPAKVIRYRT
jgi:acetyltransferase-like isoleucine patch superfamily enzyme